MCLNRVVNWSDSDWIYVTSNPIPNPKRLLNPDMNPDLNPIGRIGSKSSSNPKRNPNSDVIFFNTKHTPIQFESNIPYSNPTQIPFGSNTLDLNVTQIVFES